MTNKTSNRNNFGQISIMVWLLLLLTQAAAVFAWQQPPAKKTPNILFVIADDQSYSHAGAYGQKIFQTPNFDSIAASGILFSNAFAAAPQCSPSRAAILTGKQIWQLEEAGTHASYFPKKFTVFTDVLETAGYFLGYTGKAWDPGNFKDAGWLRNPVGPEYNKRQISSTPASGISKIDYAANFKDFMLEKPAGKPFFFWFGAHEPHRNYEEGSGLRSGLQANDLMVPAFLPGNELVKSDMLDYALEIAWYDKQLGRILQQLKDAGELENTIIVVTSDNGMPFPYAKANLQDYGVHVPLAICGVGVSGKNRRVDDLVSLIDLAPTFLDVAGLPHFKGITGKSLQPILKNNKSGNVDPSRKYVLTGRERHTHARPGNMGYPARAIRTKDYLYIENFKPDRWPLGDPPPASQVSIAGNKDMKPILEGYEDIDDSPTKSFMLKNEAAYPVLFRLAFQKRKTEELYDIKKDPFCLHDLSGEASWQPVREKLKKILEQNLQSQGDPRVTGNGDIFDSYPRFGLMRPFDGFRERGKYNPQFIKDK